MKVLFIIKLFIFIIQFLQIKAFVNDILFQSVGMWELGLDLNDSSGLENHLVQIGDGIQYVEGFD